MNCARLSIFSLVFFYSFIITCPTCIGQLKKDSPPFFSKEYEKYYENPEHKTDETQKRAQQEEQS